MSGELVVQKAVLETLWADATLLSLLAEHSYAGSPTKPAVYEFVQQAPSSEDSDRFPYVVVGDTTGAEFDTDDVNGSEHTLTLHVWDRYPGRTRCRQVVDAIYGALHKAALSVSGRDAIFCHFDGSETVPDPDVMLQHMVTRFRLVTQDS